MTVRRLRAPFQCAHQRENVDGQELLVFHVPMSPKAVMVEGDGFPYRVGDRVVMETQEAIDAHKDESRRRGYERRISTDARLADVDLELAGRFLSGSPYHGRPIEDVLRLYGLVLPRASAPAITNACMLLFGREPMVRWHPRSGCRIFRVHGTKRLHGAKRNVEQVARVDQPVALAIAETHRILKTQIRASEKLHDLFFREVPEYPEFAWQEIVINAFAHRAYEDHSREIEVWLYDDRLEVSSPGELTPPVTLELLRERRPIHASRNPVIVRVLADVGLMREAGEGIPRVFETMEASLLHPPSLSVEASAFQVTLRNQPIFEGPSLDWKRLVGRMGLPVPQKRVLLAHPTGFTNEDFRRLNGVDRDAAYREIQTMVDRGIVVPSGRGRGVIYRLSSKAPPIERLAKLRALVTERGFLKNEDYRDLFGLSRASALAELTRLVDQGFLRREGERRGTKYLAGPALGSGE